MRKRNKNRCRLRKRLRGHGVMHHLGGALANLHAVDKGGGHPRHAIIIEAGLLRGLVVVVILVAAVGIATVIFDGNALSKAVFYHLVEFWRPTGAGIATGVGEFIDKYQMLLGRKVKCDKLQ